MQIYLAERKPTKIPNSTLVLKQTGLEYINVMDKQIDQLTGRNHK